MRPVPPRAPAPMQCDERRAHRDGATTCPRPAPAHTAQRAPVHGATTDSNGARRLRIRSTIATRWAAAVHGGGVAAGAAAGGEARSRNSACRAAACGMAARRVAAQDGSTWGGSAQGGSVRGGSVGGGGGVAGGGQREAGGGEREAAGGGGGILYIVNSNFIYFYLYSIIYLFYNQLSSVM